MKPFVREFFSPINILNLVIGISGLVLGYYFYLAAQPVTKLGYVLQTELVAKLTNDDLSITKAGRLLEARTLIKSRVGAWNAGSVSIEPNSIRRPFTIEFSPDVIVYDAVMSKNSHNVSDAKLQVIGNKIEVAWKYFDPGFFFVVEILHSGVSPAQVSIRYVGDREIAAEFPRNIRESHWWFGIIGIILICVIGVSVAFVGAEFVERRWPTGLVVRGIHLKSFFFWKVTYYMMLIVGMFVIYFTLSAETFRVIIRSVLALSIPNGIAGEFYIDPI